jgi:hypothetical protein
MPIRMVLEKGAVGPRRARSERVVRKSYALRCVCRGKHGEGKGGVEVAKGPSPYLDAGQQVVHGAKSRAGLC